MPSTRASKSAIKEEDAVKLADLEGRANANVTSEKKGNHRSQRSKALVKKEVPPAADILSPKGRGKQHQLMMHQSQQKSNSGSNENNNNTTTNTNNDNSDNNNINDVNANRGEGEKKEKLSVMLIEDDVPTLLEVQSMLLRAGATEVHTASSRKKALEFLDRDSKKDIDLILADIMMPEVKIDEVKRVLKKNEKLKEVPVIVMSTVAQYDSNNDSGRREGGGSGNGSGNDLVNEYGGSLEMAATTTRSSKRLKTNDNTPQGKTNSNEVLQKPLSFRRVENVVYSHKRLLRSHNSSSSEAEKQQPQQQQQQQQQQEENDATEVDPAKNLANPNGEVKADGGETKEGSAGGSGGGSGNGSGGSGPTTVKLINNESSEEDLRKKSSDGVNNATGAAVAPTTTASDEKNKTKDAGGGVTTALPTTSDGANDVGGLAKNNLQQKQVDGNSSPPLDADVLKVRRAAATAGNERRRNDEKRWRNNRTHTRDDGDGSDEGSGAGGRNRSRSFSAEDDKTESDLKPPTVTRKKRSLRGSSAGAKKVSGGSGSDEAGLEGKLATIDGATKVTTAVGAKAAEGKDHPGLAVQLMNEHDGPTALLQLALAGSAMDSNASLRRSQSRSAFHGIIEKTQQKMQTQFQKVAAAKGKKTTSVQKKGNGTPTRAAKTTAGGKNDKMMMTMNNNNNNNNNNFGNVGLTMSAPTGSIETEEMRKARELHSMQQHHQNALYLFHTQQQMAAQQQHLMRQMSNSPGVPGAAPGQFPNFAAHMCVMGAMPPMQPFGFPPPHGQHNPFMMFPMQSFPPQSEYVNNFFQGLASTVATQHPHHQMHNHMQNMNMSHNMGGANGAGNNTATGTNNGGRTNKKDSNNNNNNVSTCADRRAQAIARFLKKRRERKFEKKVRYESRQKLAESRPRVRGQFVKLDKSLSKEQQQEVIKKMRREGEKKAGAKPTSTATVAAGGVADISASKKQSSDEKGGSNDKSKSSSKELNTTSDDDDGFSGSLNNLTSSDEKGSRGRSSNESKDGMDNDINNTNNSSDKGSDGHDGSTERRETPSV